MATASAVEGPVFRVRTLQLASGERLPCLVASWTGLPPHLPMRWAARHRRYHVQASTLEAELRVLARLYTWGARRTPPIEVDTLLLDGHELDARALESLSYDLRTRAQYVVVGAIGPDGRSTAADPGEHGVQLPAAVDTGTYDWRLGVIEDFLVWAADPAHRGGVAVPLPVIAAQQARIHAILRSLRVGSVAPSRIEPLTVHEIGAIRRTLVPGVFDRSEGSAAAPTMATFARLGEHARLRESLFWPPSNLRTWVMFETAYELGLRRGELLKLRIDSLPRGADDGILVRRLADDPHDARRRAPAVKTAERVLPASASLLALLRFYLTAHAPVGRPGGRTPYLFVTCGPRAERGRPLGMDAADRALAAVGRRAGVPLSWHRLRHTWAETLAIRLLDAPDAVAQLQYLGGWTNPSSPLRYIQHATAARAATTLRRRHEALYREAETHGAAPAVRRSDEQLNAPPDTARAASAVPLHDVAVTE